MKRVHPKVYISNRKCGTFPGNLLWMVHVKYDYCHDFNFLFFSRALVLKSDMHKVVQKLGVQGQNTWITLQDVRTATLPHVYTTRFMETVWTIAQVNILSPARGAGITSFPTFGCNRGLVNQNNPISSSWGAYNLFNRFNTLTKFWFLSLIYTEHRGDDRRSVVDRFLLILLQCACANSTSCFGYL